MNRTLIIRLCLIVLLLVLAKKGWDRVEADMGMMLVYFICLGTVAGLLVVKYFLPWFGDAVGTAVYFSGERVGPGEGTEASAKLAHGDYEGAIAEHEKTLAEDPAQSLLVVEIAKICADKLHDPQRALQVLQKHLTARAWPEDDAAFLRFRIVEIHLQALKDFARARTLLEQIVADYPNTRHSANAHHKLHELEQVEYKHLTDQRAKAGGHPAA